MEEDEVKQISELSLLTANVAMLTAAVKTINDVLLVVLAQADINPELLQGKSKEDFEKEIRPKIDACEKVIREIYGRSETNKG